MPHGDAVRYGVQLRYNTDKNELMFDCCCSLVFNQVLERARSKQLKFQKYDFRVKLFYISN